MYSEPQSLIKFMCVHKVSHEGAEPTSKTRITSLAPDAALLMFKSTLYLFGLLLLHDGTWASKS